MKGIPNTHNIKKTPAGYQVQFRVRKETFSEVAGSLEDAITKRDKLALKLGKTKASGSRFLFKRSLATKKGRIPFTETVLPVGMHMAYAYKNDTEQWLYSSHFRTEGKSKLSNKAFYIGTTNTINPEKLHVAYNRCLLFLTEYRKCVREGTLSDFEPASYNKAEMTDQEVYDKLYALGINGLGLIARKTAKREMWISEEISNFLTKKKSL